MPELVRTQEGKAYWLQLPDTLLEATPLPYPKGPLSKDRLAGVQRSSYLDPTQDHYERPFCFQNLISYALQFGFLRSTICERVQHEGQLLRHALGAKTCRRKEDRIKESKYFECVSLYIYVHVCPVIKQFLPKVMIEEKRIKNKTRLDYVKAIIFPFLHNILGLLNVGLISLVITLGLGNRGHIPGCHLGNYN